MKEKRTIKTIEIKNIDAFQDIIAKLANGKSQSDLSREMGYSRNYLAQAINTQQIGGAGFNLLAYTLGIERSKLMEIIQQPPCTEKESSKCPEIKHEEIQIADLFEIIRRQNEMIASIGKILTNIEDILEKAWK